MKAGEIKYWLDQGPAVLLEMCKVEAESIELGEEVSNNLTEDGWVIYLLETEEILTVHTETLTDAEDLGSPSTGELVSSIRQPSGIFFRIFNPKLTSTTIVGE